MTYGEEYLVVESPEDNLEEVEQEAQIVPEWELYNYNH